MDRLKLAEMLGFFYGISDKYPKVTRFIEEIADYLYAPVSYNANQHTNCVGNALGALEMDEVDNENPEP